MKIITPLRPHNFTEFLRLYQQINHRAHIIELWLDAVENIDDFLEVFQAFKEKNTPEQFLAVCKSPDQKGTFDGNNETRIEILKKFLNADGDFIDLDVTTFTLEQISSLNSNKLVCSFHDFTSVPDNLPEIYENMKILNPAIYKFAITTNTNDEWEKFHQFVKRFPKDIKSIFTTMGKLGNIGRQKLKSNTWGQFYALNEDSKTATGQLTLADLQN
jgi:3-dehydroquinate dehydratase-1